MSQSQMHSMNTFSSATDFEHSENTTARDDSANPQLQEHRYKLSNRLVMMVCSLLLGGLGLLMLVAFTVSAISKPEEFDVSFVRLGLYVLWTAFWLGSCVSAWWLGRLELREDRASLPRFGFAPWSFLPLHEIPLSQVIRWGVGLQRAKGGHVSVLMLETPHATQHGCMSVQRIALGMYPKKSQHQILEYFAERLSEPTQLENSSLGLAFPKA